MSTVNPCCCCSLRTGGMVIGVLGIIAGVIAIITSIIALGLGVAVHEDIKKYGPDKDAKVITTLLVIVSAIWLLIGVLSIVFGILLLYAIQQKSAYLLKVWIIAHAISLILGIGLSVASYAITFTWVNLILDFVGILLSLWFISVVYYLRKEILQGG